ETNVRYSTILAPFDGIIGISQVKFGSAVAPGQTLLNTISSEGPVLVDITVDQREIYRFTTLQQRGASAKDSTFRLAFSGQIYPQPGRILPTDRPVNPLTGTIIVRVEFPTPDGTLRAGMAGTLRVLSNTAEKSIVIPLKAVTEQLGEYFVYVVKTDSAKVSQQ